MQNKPFNTIIFPAPTYLTLSNVVLCFISMLLLLGVITGKKAFAEDVNFRGWALLIGVGNHQYIADPLPGIDIDIIHMMDTAKLMGFENIRVLSDAQATLAKVKAELTQVIANAAPDDHVLIYFSGHGSNTPDINNDEIDQVDEVLVLYDTRPVIAEGQMSLQQSLLDDEFFALLQQIRSRNILVLVDACHSGSMTRGLGLSDHPGNHSGSVSKSFLYAGMPGFSKETFSRQKLETDDFLVTLSAARDDEKAIATPQGSLFTRGIKQAVIQAAAEKRTITPQQLTDAAASYIAQNNVKTPFHPQLSGNERLINKAIRIRAAYKTPMRQKLQALAAPLDNLAMQVNQVDYSEGDRLVISLKIERSGYLNVINIGPNDEPTLLFPNRFHVNNRVDPGIISLPNAAMKFDFVAQKPYGKSLTVAFLSSEAINLYHSESVNNAASDMDKPVFLNLSALGLQELKTRGNFAVQEKTHWTQAGFITTHVRQH